MKWNGQQKGLSLTNLLRGSIATPSIVAAIMNGKYVNSIPLACHESEFLRYGVNLSRQTMANWIIRCSEEYLSLLYDEMKKHPLSCCTLFMPMKLRFKFYMKKIAKQPLKAGCGSTILANFAMCLLSSCSTMKKHGMISSQGVSHGV